MKTNRKDLYFCSLTAFILSTLIVECSRLELGSKWRDFQINIDGNDTEWQDSSIYYDEKAHVIIGMFNDDDSMYILLSLLDRTMQSQFLRLGFTIWFDSTGGKKKTFGIHFPLGMQAGGIQMMARGETADLKNLKRMLEGSQEEIEILGPGREHSCRMLVADVKTLGIDAKIGRSKGFLLYELKVPLNTNTHQPFAIGTDMTGAISIGFESGQIDMEEMRKIKREDRGGMGRRPGGEGRRRGGMGRGRGEMDFGRGGRVPKTFELWAKVHLAKGTSNMP